jgi:hypothetical protein
MEANKNDANKCILLANEAASNYDYEKAVKLIEKSMRLYPTESARGKSMQVLSLKV